MSFIITILAALLVFSAVIAIHEFGHFAVAKLCGIQVNEFSIGMGPVLWKKNHKGTQYSLRALPVGGFVALEGEESPESQQAETAHTVQEQPAPETEASVQPTGIPLKGTGMAAGTGHGSRCCHEFRAGLCGAGVFDRRPE